MRFSFNPRSSRAPLPQVFPVTADVWQQPWASLGISFNFCWGLPSLSNSCTQRPMSTLGMWLVALKLTQRQGVYRPFRCVPASFLLSRRSFYLQWQWWSDWLPCLRHLCGFIFNPAHNNRQIDGEVLTRVPPPPHTHNGPKQGVILPWTWHFKDSSLLATWEPFSHLFLWQRASSLLNGPDSTSHIPRKLIYLWQSHEAVGLMNTLQIFFLE